MLCVSISSKELSTFHPGMFPQRGFDMFSFRGGRMR